MFLPLALLATPALAHISPELTGCVVDERERSVRAQRPPSACFMFRSTTRRRHEEGLLPSRRLKALLNAGPESYPTRSAISLTVSLPSLSIVVADCILQRVRYASGGSPTRELKRAANGDRDEPTAAASAAMVHGRFCSRWMRPRAAPIWGSRIAPSHPPSPAGSLSTHARRSCTKTTSVSRVTIVSVPARGIRVSAASNRIVASSQSGA